MNGDADELVAGVDRMLWSRTAAYSPESVLKNVRWAVQWIHKAETRPDVAAAKRPPLGSLMPTRRTVSPVCGVQWEREAEPRVFVVAASTLGREHTPGRD